MLGRWRARRRTWSARPGSMPARRKHVSRRVPAPQCAALRWCLTGDITGGVVQTPLPLCRPTAPHCTAPHGAARRHSPTSQATAGARPAAPARINPSWPVCPHITLPLRLPPARPSLCRGVRQAAAAAPNLSVRPPHPPPPGLHHHHPLVSSRLPCRCAAAPARPAHASASPCGHRRVSNACYPPPQCCPPLLARTMTHTCRPPTRADLATLLSTDALRRRLVKATAQRPHPPFPPRRLEDCKIDLPFGWTIS